MRKVLAFLLLFLMILPPLAAPRTVLSEGEPEPEIVEEVLGLRETNSETYALSDGSYECVVYASDKYYDAGGSVPELIDNSVIEKRFAYGGKEYAYSNAANSTRYYFASEAPDILISNKTKYLSFSLAGAASVTAVPGGSRENKQIGDLNLSGDNYIAYKGAFEGVEFVYAAKNGVLKEYIVLESPEAPTSFTFLYDTESYTAGYSEEGFITFFDKDGEPVFELANLFAIDSAEAYTEELTYTVGEPENGITPITVTLSEEYANDPERVWPIVIDPTTSIHGSSVTADSFVSSNNPTTNYYLNDYLRFGYGVSYHTSRSYVKFTIPDNVMHKDVTLSYISLRPSNVSNSPSLKAYRVTGSWTSSTINWNNKPSYSTTNGSATAGVVGNWYRFYVTDIVADWVHESLNNYGFLIKDTADTVSGTWSTFYSSDYSSDYAPQLRIRYVNRYGSRGMDEIPFTYNINCMGYALEFVDAITPTDFGVSIASLNGQSIANVQNTFVTQIQAWMNSNCGSSHWQTLTAYDSSIQSGWYRVAFRIGIEDTGTIGFYNTGEWLDFHWMYQTNKDHGIWAQKKGANPSEEVLNSNGIDPVDFSWTDGSDDHTYNGDIFYYAIEDIRYPHWVEAY